MQLASWVPKVEIDPLLHLKKLIRSLLLIGKHLCFAPTPDKAHCKKLPTIYFITTFLALVTIHYYENKTEKNVFHV